MNKFINCPHCNYQYLPGEIFDPKHFLGQPKNVIRNSLGEILGYEGIKMDLEETFVCEHCNKEFEVYAKLSFSIKEDELPTLKMSELPPIQQLSIF
jgi:hypothetical protein